ncbi:MAG: 16S rRNA (uracil(1498)-N(3))-methyltransferase [Pseudomonadota bacterium]|nr:16S rRNA (uracil(1498)-N(3))-methyltransferase [Pseudomonadota bacterium]
MRVPRIFIFDIIDSNDEYILDRDQSHYLKNVLRLKTSMKVRLFNGSGYEYLGIINKISKNSVNVAVLSKEEKNNESPLKVNLIIAISRASKFDYLIQKLTELGVSSITPIQSERSEIKIRSKDQSKKIEHWEKIAISACQQCDRDRPPKIHGIGTFYSIVTVRSENMKFILEPSANSALSSSNIEMEEICMLSGPEGGFSPKELLLAEEHGFKPVSLGPRILRTETAPIVALSIAQSKWGDCQ